MHLNAKTWSMLMLILVGAYIEIGVAFDVGLNRLAAVKSTAQGWNNTCSNMTCVCVKKCTAGHVQGRKRKFQNFTNKKTKTVSDFSFRLSFREPHVYLRLHHRPQICADLCRLSSWGSSLETTQKCLQDPTVLKLVRQFMRSVVWSEAFSCFFFVFSHWVSL